MLFVYFMVLFARLERSEKIAKIYLIQRGGFTYIHSYRQSARVTRLGEFSPIKRLFILDTFLKINAVAQILEVYFSNVCMY
jgi:hypothetical protein